MEQVLKLHGAAVAHKGPGKSSLNLRSGEGADSRGDSVFMKCAMQKDGLSVATVVNQRAVLVCRSFDGKFEPGIELRRVANLQNLEALDWLPEEGSSGNSVRIIMGYANGLLRVIHVEDKDKNKEFVPHGSRVIDFSFTKGLLWVLYEDKMVMSVQTASLLAAPSWTEPRGLRFWKLLTKGRISRFSVFRTEPQNEIPVREDAQGAECFSIFTTGVNPAWAIFQTESSPNQSLAKIAYDSLSSRVAAFAGSLYGMKKTTETASSSESPNSRRETRLTPSCALYDSPSREVSGHLNSHDPSRRFCVSVDMLGRVVLIDTRNLLISKIWKGYRDAQTAWMTHAESWTNGIGQYLVILAPWRKSLQIWRVPGIVLVASIRLSGCDLRTTHLVHSAGQSWLLNDFGEGLELQKLIGSQEMVDNLFYHLNRTQDQNAAFLAHCFQKALYQKRYEECVSLLEQVRRLDGMRYILKTIDDFPEEEFLPFGVRKTFWKLAMEFLQIHSHSDEGILISLESKFRLLELYNSLVLKENETSFEQDKSLPEQCGFLPLPFKKLPKQHFEYILNGKNRGETPLSLRAFLLLRKPYEFTDSLAVLLFEPVMVDAFKVKTVLKVLKSFGFGDHEILAHFLDFWFSLPLTRVLHAIEVNSQGLSKFLQGLSGLGFLIKDSIWKQALTCHAAALCQVISSKTMEAAEIDDLKGLLNKAIVVSAEAQEFPVSVEKFVNEFAALAAKCHFNNSSALETVIDDEIACHFLEILVQSKDLDKLKRFETVLQGATSMKVCQSIALRFRREILLPSVSNVDDPEVFKCFTAILEVCLGKTSNDRRLREDSWPKSSSSFSTSLLDKEALEMDCTDFETNFKQEIAALKVKQLSLRLIVGNDESLRKMFVAKEPLWSLGFVEKGNIEVESEAVRSHRKKFFRAVLEQIDLDSFLIALANELRLSEEDLEIELISLHFLRGDDVKATDLQGKIRDRSKLANALIPVARERMARIIRSLEANPQHRQLLASIPPDVCKWIRACKSSPATKNDLAGTVVLLRSVRGDLEKENSRVVQMLSIAEILSRQTTEVVLK